MRFFKSKPVVSEDDEKWIQETVIWLINNFPSYFAVNEKKLITPSRDYFPNPGKTTEDRAINLFQDTLRLAGMEDWPVQLEAQESDPEVHVAPTVLIQNAPRGPAGTFRVENKNEAVISFNWNLVNDGWALVATFAHELSHYLTSYAKEEPPGGWDNWEFATDLTAVFLGFGIFLANSSFKFQQFVDMESQTQGWSARNQGYLSENELIYVLCLFVLIYGVDAKLPLRYLKDSLKGRYKKALDHIKNTDFLNTLSEFRASISTKNQ